MYILSMIPYTAPPRTVSTIALKSSNLVVTVASH